MTPPFQTSCSPRSLVPVWLVIALVASLLTGCAIRGVPLPAISRAINSTLHQGTPTLGPEDEIEVRFVGYEARNHTTRIEEDGRAVFLEIGALHVAGLTLEQLASRLTEAYGTNLEGVPIHVLLTTPGWRHVLVGGEVQSPGEVPIDGERLTLIQALTRRGGIVKDSGDLGRVVLVRWIPDEQRQMVWTIDARLEHWGQESPLLLQPHDVVFVPNTAVDKVNIWVDKYLRRNIPFIVPWTVFTQ